MSAQANKVALVTGAATGIGQATAEYLAEAGWAVFGIGLDGAAGRLAFPDRPNRPVFRETDLTDLAAIAEAIAELHSRFGRLDGVVNCAGIYVTGPRAEDLTDADWSRTLEINLTAPFRICRATLPLLRSSGGGSVVNVASVHAEATVPGAAAYAASKAGLVGLSRQLALDYAVDLAESWERSADELSVRFTLRQGATFHSGRAITADDVAFTIKRYLTEEVGANLMERMESFTGVTVIDPQTFDISLSSPTPGLFDLLSAVFVQDSETIVNIAKSDAGSGPYQLSAFEPGVSFVMTKVPGHWRASLGAGRDDRTAVGAKHA